MKYAIIVHAPPHRGQGAYSAYRFAEAVLKAGHSIHRVFFYQDGVYNADASSVIPQDEQSLSTQWQALAERFDFELVACISSCARRGLFNEQEAERQQRQPNLASGFEVEGLGQYVDAQHHADRVVSFRD